MERCPWVDLTKDDYIAYHDVEWGVPVHDDKLLFEFLTLESAQAGLSWITILRKRENFRRAFAGFDPEKVARFGDQDVERLLKDSGIIRNRLKINAAINNARKFLDIRDAFGSFDHYIWGFVAYKPIIHELYSAADYPSLSPESRALSQDLKQRGFKFVGPTIIYAHMQATGMVNDHSMNCFRRQQIMDSY